MVGTLTSRFQCATHALSGRLDRTSCFSPILAHTVESLTLEGWEGGAPVRAVLLTPDRSQTHAAERVTLKLLGRETALVLHQMV